MNIRQALNRISLSIILEDDLEWKNRGELKYASKTSKITISSKQHLITRSITRTSSAVDKYYFESILQNGQGHVILTHKIRVNLPHNDEPISESLSPSRKLDFIALNEEGRFNSQSYWIGKSAIENNIIKYAEGIIIPKDKKGVKQIAK